MFSSIVATFFSSSGFSWLFKVLQHVFQFSSNPFAACRMGKGEGSIEVFSIILNFLLGEYKPRSSFSGKVRLESRFSENFSAALPLNFNHLLVLFVRRIFFCNSRKRMKIEVFQCEYSSSLKLEAFQNINRVLYAQLWPPCMSLLILHCSANKFETRGVNKLDLEIVLRLTPTTYI